MIRMSLLLLYLLPLALFAEVDQRPRQLGIKIGVLPTGKHNAITDVNGVKVGHTTITRGDSIRTGVTVILPHNQNVFQEKVPAAVYVANGFGKLAGATQVIELGNLETPVVLTNTLSVSTAIEALIQYTLNQAGNENVQSVNAVVGETNDSWLNDIRGLHVKKQDVLSAIENANEGPVAEGNVGAGTGTVCFGFKGGIGSASRKLPRDLGGYTIGVLVQTNFGGVLSIAGVPVGEELKKFAYSDRILNDVDGSCMIVVATDAPLDSRNLQRLAKRAFLGLGRTGGIASNGSGDYVIAFSTSTTNRIRHDQKDPLVQNTILHNDYISPLFMAVIEATEEAIVNSLFAAKSLSGKNGRRVEALPVDKVVELFKKHNQLKK